MKGGIYEGLGLSFRGTCRGGFRGDASFRVMCRVRVLRVKVFRVMCTVGYMKV